MVHEEEITLSIDACIKYFKCLLTERLRSFFEEDTFDEDVYDYSFLDNFPNSPIASLTKYFSLSGTEFVLLVTAITSYLDPHLIANTIKKWHKEDISFPEIGGVYNKGKMFMPTIETVVFIVAGNDWRKRILAQKLLDRNAVLFKEDIVCMEDSDNSNTAESGVIFLAESFKDIIITGKLNPVDAGSDFPLTKLSTRRYWDDLVITDETEVAFNDITTWLQQNNRVKEQAGIDNIPAGYKALLYAASGTGKTETVKIFAKWANRDLYKIDLLQLFNNSSEKVFKLIDKLLYKAERSGWILLADEVDRLMDNQNTVAAYLLRKLLAHDGIVFFESITISGLQENFFNKLKSIIRFTIPGVALRKKLWQYKLPATLRIDHDVDIDAISEQYVLTGAAIAAIIENIMLYAEANRDSHLKQESIIKAIENFLALHPQKNGSLQNDNTKNKEQKIYFSYAWGEENDASVNRETIVTQLYESLQKDGYVVVRDKTDLGFKGFISDFMMEIGSADKIIVVISEKYVQSPFCMFELYEIARNSKFEKKLFSHRIVPVMFEFIDFANIATIDKYLTYWKEKQQEWESLFKKSMGQLSKEQFTRYNNTRLIAQHIAEIMDWMTDMNTLNPQILSADNFKIIKQSLCGRLTS